MTYVPKGNDELVFDYSLAWEPPPRPAGRIIETMMVERGIERVTVTDPGEEPRVFYFAGGQELHGTIEAARRERFTRERRGL
jgi:hypothetical protein